MNNEIRSIPFLGPVFKRLQEKLSYVLIAMSATVGGIVVLLSWQISDLSRANLALRLHEDQLHMRLTLEPATMRVRSESRFPDLPEFDAFQSVVVDMQRSFEDMRLTVRDATHTPQVTDADNTVGKVEMAVHAKGEYQSIKKAIAALLAQHEEVALKSIALARDQSTDGSPQVEARFTFFYGKPK